jgi:hypothetical protein
MPTGIEIQDTTYAGEVKNIMLVKFITGFDSMKKGLIAIQPGIKKSMTVPTLDVSNIIQPRIEGEIGEKHSGKIKVDKRVLIPQDIMIFVLFNPRNFEAHWFAVQMNPNLLDAELPVNVENAITSRMMELGGNYMETAFWQSVKNQAAIDDAVANGFADGANRNIFFNGVLVRMLNDPKVIIVPSATLSKTNIFAELEKIKLATPLAIKENPDLKYVMNPNTFEIYEMAQQGQNFKGAVVTDAGKRTYAGKEIVVVTGIPDNTILVSIYRTDLGGNLWLGLNEMNEEQILELKKYRSESELFFIKGLIKVDANYAFGEQAVLYTNWTAPAPYENY